MVEFFHGNRSHLFGKIKSNSMVLLSSGQLRHRTADQSYPYQVNKNFYYLTGIRQANITLAMVKIGEECENFLFLDEYDSHYEKWIGKRITKDEASLISGIPVNQIFFQKEYEAWEKSLLDSQAIHHCYLDLEKPNFMFYSSFGQETYRRIQALTQSMELLDVYPLIVAQRMIKQQYELDLIQESIKDTQLGVEALLRNAKPGMFEYELEAYYDYVVKSKGKTTSFTTIAASGKNAVTLHYEVNNQKTSDGDLILFDLGVSTLEYASDITRTFPVNGKFSDRQKILYEIVLQANKETIAMIRPGYTLRQVNEFTKRFLAKACLSIGLITEEAQIDQYYYHGVSHSLGLDTHDPFLPDTVLAPGMVVTCEPGLYVAEESIGIRIEDDVLVTSNGSINLSSDIAKEIEDIELLMHK